MLSSTLSSWVIPITRALDAAGHDSRDLLRQAGIDPERVRDANVRFAASHVTRLWELAAIHTGDPGFGLEVAHYWHPSSLHALGYAWLASHSLREGLRRLIRYSRVVNSLLQGRLEDLGTGITRFTVLFPQTDEALRPEPMDCGLATIVTMCRYSLGPGFSPAALAMRRSPPPDPDRFQQFFGCPVTYLAELNTIEFRTDDLTVVLPTANSEQARASDSIIQEYLARQDSADISQQIRTWILQRLPAGPVSEKALADALHMSTRSLQRRLRDDGMTFISLLDDLRRELAMQYLQDSHLTLTEITYLLGFADQSSFTRAFRRWTSLSPNAWRTRRNSPV